MSDILIRNIPKDMQAKLKDRAKQHHRSMVKEIYAILEESLKANEAVKESPTPYQGSFQITNKFIDDAKRSNRQWKRWM